MNYVRIIALVDFGILQKGQVCKVSPKKARQLILKGMASLYLKAGEDFMIPKAEVIREGPQ